MSITKKITAWLGNSGKSTDMTAGKIMPILISFAMPVMVGNLFQ